MRLSKYTFYILFIFYIIIYSILLAFSTNPPITLKARKIFEGKEEENYRIKYTTSYVIDDYNNIYILDPLRQCVMKYDSGGSYIKTIGRKWKNKAEFMYIRSLDIVNNKLIAGGPTKIHYLTLNGEYLRNKDIEFQIAWQRRFISESKYIQFRQIDIEKSNHSIPEDKRIYTMIIEIVDLEQATSKTIQSMKISWKDTQRPKNKLGYRNTNLERRLFFDLSPSKRILFGRTDEFKVYEYKDGKIIELVSEVGYTANEYGNKIQAVAGDNLDNIWIFVDTVEYVGLKKYSKYGGFIEKYKITPKPKFFSKQRFIFNDKIYYHIYTKDGMISIYSSSINAK